MRKIIINLMVLILRKEGIEMMAMLWAQKIMKQETLEAARSWYKRVPRLLKEKVKEILIDSGMEEITKDVKEVA